MTLPVAQRRRPRALRGHARAHAADAVPSPSTSSSAASARCCCPPAGGSPQPTNVVAPGAPAIALQAPNNLNQILVDDASQTPEPRPDRVRPRRPAAVSASNTLRGGDTATDTGRRHDLHLGRQRGQRQRLPAAPDQRAGRRRRLQAANPRPTARAGRRRRRAGRRHEPAQLLQHLRRAARPVDNCTLGVGGAPTDCRGADTQAEFDRQWPKTVAAISALDADVIGVNEIENDGYGPDSAHPVPRGQAQRGHGAGHLRLHRRRRRDRPDERARHRRHQGRSDLQAGRGHAGRPDRGAQHRRVRQRRRRLLRAAGRRSPRRSRQRRPAACSSSDVNHLKSKGSARATPRTPVTARATATRCAPTPPRRCAPGWPPTRPARATRTSCSSATTTPTQGGSDRGARGRGYTNLVADVSAPTLLLRVRRPVGLPRPRLRVAVAAPQVTGVAEYHINADEPSVLDYNTDFKSAGQLESASTRPTSSASPTTTRCSSASPPCGPSTPRGSRDRSPRLTASSRRDRRSR